MNTPWYIHSATLKQLSLRWTLHNIYIPQLWNRFPWEEYSMIYTFRNFKTTLLALNTPWYKDTATLKQLSLRWTLHDIYIPQLLNNFRCNEHSMIYTFRNFEWTFLAMNSPWYIHSATLKQLSLRWTLHNIYIPQLSNRFPWEEYSMIYTFRNFKTTLLALNTPWYRDTATLKKLSLRWTLHDIYIPQLLNNFRCDEHSMIYTFRNFDWTFLAMNAPLDIHSATLKQLSLWWTHHDIYIPQL